MKKMSKGMLMTALICGAVYLGGSPVYANELQEFALDEYVVTAARTETKLVDTPANISVVDAQTIEERHYQDVSEVLKDVPGVNVVDKGIGATEKVIRVNGDDRVLVLVNGRRINSDIGSTSGGRNNMDLNLLPDVNLIEKVEILKGAGGALYGSEAVGGVVNIITKKVDDSNGKVSLAFGNNDSREVNTMYSFKENKTGVILSASKNKQGYFKYRDYKTKSTKRWPGSSKYENEKVSFKLEQEFSDSTNIEIGYDYSKYDGNSFNSALYEGTPLEKNVNNIYAKFNWLLKEHNSGYIQFYHNDLEYYNLIPGDEGNYNEKTNGLDIQQVITTSDNNKMVLGSSWRKSDVSTYGPNEWSNVYDESVDNIALYVNDTYEFAPTWTLNLGARYDNHSEAGNETTLSAGLNKKINENSHFYINWGEVFRAPATDDLFYNCGGSFTMIGDRNLKPETGDTWSVGYSTKLNTKTGLSINYFESDLEDAIRWKDYTTYWKVENVDKQRKKGLELNADYILNENISLEASYTYLKVEEMREGKSNYSRDYNAIPNTYRFGIKYQDGKWNGNLWLRSGNGASHINYLDSSYLTVDMAVTYKATRDLNFFVKGYNLFNEAYAEHGGHNGSSYNYPAQSRRFIVGAEYKF